MKTQRFLLAVTLSFTASLMAAELTSDSGRTEILPDMSAGIGCGQVLPASPRIENALESFQKIKPLSLDPAAANEKLARDAISPDSSIAQSAIAALREQGPAGLEIMLSVHAESIRSHTVGFAVPSIQKSDFEWLRLRSALDAITRQRDSYTSKLYWFTDFEQAKAAARASGKPILSLRLLGNLDDELSCANSRFFRTRCRVRESWLARVAVLGFTALAVIGWFLGLAEIFEVSLLLGILNLIVVAVDNVRLGRTMYHVLEVIGKQLALTPVNGKAK